MNTAAGPRLRSARPVAVLSVLGVLLVLVGLPGSPARAALGGLTDFAIDGDTAGPNDWDALPAAIISSSTVAEDCGNGIDPDQLDGKLADLDLEAPNPIPGNVTGKADVCQVWRALEMVPDESGGLDVVLYGAWLRYASNGEMSAFWPLMGPAPGMADDYLIKFDSSSSGISVELFEYTGSGWQSTGPLGAGVFEVAYDDPGAPLFGEFALNLSEAELWPGSGVDQCTTFTSEFMFTQTGNASAAELQDYVGIPPAQVTACGELVVDKQTTPTTPIPPADFDYAVDRVGGGDATPGDPTVGGTLTVPGDGADTYNPVLGGNDFTLTEVQPLPAGWALGSIVCSAVNPETGDREDYDVTGGGTYPVTPGTTTRCTITNVGPDATLTVAKVAPPDDGSAFDFSVTGVPPFALGDRESVTFPLDAGSPITIAELPVPDGWQLDAIVCVGDDDPGEPSISEGSGGSVVVNPDAGEQIVCVFANAPDPPPGAALAVVKFAPANEGTGFPFTVSAGTPDSFTLTPPGSPFQLITGLTPDPDAGTDYIITESVPEGWGLVALRCASTDATMLARVDPDGGTATVTLKPGELGLCVFGNAPLPPPLARLTVVKQTEPAGGTGFDFSASTLTPSSFSLDDGGSVVFPDLVPGRYNVTENVPADWQVSGSCTDGTIIRNGSATVGLDFGDDVTCTFMNVARASLRVTKVADPQSAQVFPFSVTVGDGPGSGFALDDDGDGTGDPDAGRYPNSVAGADLPPGTYTVSEQPVAGWTLTGLDCAGDGAASTDVGTGTAVIDLPPGGSASCTYTNAQVVTPTPTPTPTVTPTPTPSPTVTPEPSPTPTPTSTASPSEEATDEPTEAAVAGGGGDGDLADTGADGALGRVLLGTAALLIGAVLLVIARRSVQRS